MGKEKSLASTDNRFLTSGSSSKFGVIVNCGRFVPLLVFVAIQMINTPRNHTQPPIQWVPEALSQGIKRPEHEADHSPPTSAEIKKTWIYTSTPAYAFMA
jgi:hypothetical protein